MRPLCFNKILFSLLLCTAALVASADKKSALVYYGKDISYSNAGIHDYIIVEPENVSSYTHGFRTYAKKIYAYVSIGEAEPYRSYFKEIKPQWKIAENRAWGSVVMDISDDAYHTFVYDKVIQPMVDKGYENFFFDTLDSYQILAQTQDERDKYEQGLIRFIKKFKARYPQSKLIVNRGFEVMDEIHASLDAVLFESLFYGLATQELVYREVEEEDREWLLSQLKKVKSYGLDVICLDYIDLKQTQKIEQTLKKIEKLGLIPYISNKELTRYGNSSKRQTKREVLLLYNTDQGKELSNAHKLASLPLEYLGYVPIVKDMREGLPEREELTRYKGVIVWLEAEASYPLSYEKWVKELVKSKQKVLFLDGFGVNNDDSLCDFLGITKVTNKAALRDKQSISYQDSMIGFESDVSAEYSEALYQPQNARALLTLRNSRAQESVPAAITQWGGYVLSSYVTNEFNENYLWLINPFALFKESLDLESLPVPDPTTQNGRRLLFSHIDGDASMNRAQWDSRQYSIGVTYDNILKKYTIPQSVSIVAAETSEEGIYPKDSAALEAIAKKIYALEHVEAATHTYSHPFFWKEIKDDDLDEAYRLKVPGYDFSIDKEIRGSLAYINSQLLPDGKKKADTVYWTGDCMPTEEVLAYTYKQGLLNINGGETTITNDKPWLFYVHPYGLKRGEYYQIYTGAQNENVYTNNFTGPFWGYKKVIQTFKLTESPRRLKPINIYYHFYSASKTASLKALQDVFEWALDQESMPIFTSEYIPKVMEFYDVSMRQDENSWHFEGMKALKTLRLDGSLPAVSFKDSKAVLGQKVKDEVRYIHLNTAVDSIDLVLNEEAEADENYIIDTNAEVLQVKESPEQIEFRLSGHVNIVLNYRLKEGCQLTSQPKATRTQIKGNELSLKFYAKEADVIVTCN
ncbi:MAG: endo alpha-1,4 polygalactosaminidase [Campylobacterales bacterium]|nr:endo alpha-1,4 polygalactosaminidase [Campylobacterales bacterium]